MSEPTPLRVLAFAGSTREASLNRRLLRLAARGAERAGAQVDLVEPADLRLPLYDGERELAEGMPAAARALKRRLAASRALLVASPEHDGGYAALLKNALDWLSRSPEKPEPHLADFRGRVAGLLSASPGPVGGARGLVQLRAVLSMLGCVALPEDVTLGRALDAFGPDGEPGDPGLRERAERLGARVVELARRLGPDR